MGAVAAGFADRIYVTSDNPRSEESAGHCRRNRRGHRHSRTTSSSSIGAARSNARSREARCGRRRADRRKRSRDISDSSATRCCRSTTWRSRARRSARADGVYNESAARSCARPRPARRSSTRRCAPATLRASTDTRTIEPGDTFVALRGERFDGHDFAPRPCGAARPCSLSNASRRGLPASPRCSSRRRRRPIWRSRARRECSLAAASSPITGSAGKTTTKSFLAQLLAACDTAMRVLGRTRKTRTTRSVSASCFCTPRTKRTTCSSSRWARATYGDIAASRRDRAPANRDLDQRRRGALEIMGSRERLEGDEMGAFFRRRARDPQRCRRRLPPASVRSPRIPRTGLPPSSARCRLTEFKPLTVLRRRRGARSPR